MFHLGPSSVLRQFLQLVRPWRLFLSSHGLTLHPVDLLPPYVSSYVSYLCKPGYSAQHVVTFLFTLRVNAGKGPLDQFSGFIPINWALLVM